jgi:WD40 repeat protein
MKVDIKRIAHLTGHRAAVYALSEGEVSQLFLSAAGDGWIVSWDLANPEIGKLIAQTDTSIFSLFYLKTQGLLIAGNKDGGVHFINLKNNATSKNIQHHTKGVFDIKLIENHILTLGGDGYLTSWDINGKQATESIQLSTKSLRKLATSNTRSEIAIGCSDGNIFILNKKNWETIHLIKEAHKSSVFSLSYSPDDHYLITGGRDAMLNIFDVEKGYALTQSQPAHLFTINDIKFNPILPEIFATASRDKTIKIWHLTEGVARLLKVIDTIRHGCHINSVNQLLWTADGKRLISASDDRSLMIWDIDVN